MENQPQAAPSGSKSTIWIIILVVVLIVAGGAYYFLAQDDGTNTNASGTINSLTNGISNTSFAENKNAVVTATTLGSVETYTNPFLGFSIHNPEQLTIREFSVNPDTISLFDGRQLVCATNFSPDSALHPESSEIVICFNVFDRENRDLAAWYDGYSAQAASVYDLYESVEHEQQSINGYTAIQESITTGQEPRSEADSGWLDAKKLNYYFATGSFVLQIESIVNATDASLLEATTKLINSISFAE